MDIYYKHFTHPINIMLRDYNDFVKITFKILCKKDVANQNPRDVAYALKLAKRLGLNLNKNHLSVSFLKMRE